MELRLLEYIVAIEKYSNMTEAAQQLFITPSALNQQLLKLEKELDLPLFTRSRRRMIPTEAGRIYLETAKQMLSLRQAAYSHLQDLAGSVSGSYRVGLTFDHGSDVFARIYTEFHKKYPGVQMRCYQLLVPEMMEMLSTNELDLAFVLGGSQESFKDLEYQTLSSENLLLGLHKSHPLAQGVKLSDCPSVTIDLDKVRQDNFAVALKRSTMRSELIDPMFERAGIAPNIMIESSLNGFLEQLAASGICDAIVPQSRVQNYEDIAWFYLPGAPRFNFGVAYPKGYRLNRALEEFIDLARRDAMKSLYHDPPQAESKIFYSGF